MSANPEAGSYSETEKTSIDIELEIAQLNQIYNHWLETNGDEINLKNALNLARISGNISQVLKATDGYLAMMSVDSAAFQPVASYRRAQAAIVNLLPKLPRGRSEEDLMDRLLDEAQQAIDSPRLTVARDLSSYETDQIAPFEEMHIDEAEIINIGRLLASVKPPDLDPQTDGNEDTLGLSNYQGSLAANLAEIVPYKKVSKKFLIERAQQGDSFALEMLCLNSLKTIVRQVNDYIESAKNNPLRREAEFEVDELIQVALMEVPKVVGRFDIKNVTFYNAFLGKRIWGSIIDYVRSSSSSVGLSRMRYDLLHKALERGRVNDNIQSLVEGGFIEAPTYIKDGALELSNPSLEALFEQNCEAASLVDTIDPEDMLIAESDNKQLEDIVNKLPERQRYMIAHYYGLFGLADHTLAEIGDSAGYSESRASQIHTKALDNLRELMLGRTIKKPHIVSHIEIDKNWAHQKILEKLYKKLEKYKEAALYQQDVAGVIEILPDWNLAQTFDGLDNIARLNRSLPENFDINGFSTNKGGAICLDEKNGVLDITFRNPKGSDLLSIIELETYISGGDPEVVAHLSPQQLKVLCLLHKPYKHIALELSLEVSTIRTHIHHMCKKTGLDSADLAIYAADRGFIKLESLPDNKGLASLTSREYELACGFYNTSYEAASEAMDLSLSTIRTHWHSIYNKTGTTSRIQVALLLFKEGLVTLPMSLERPIDV